MLKIQTKSSNSGSTKQYHIIIDENNVDIKSYAALVLLNEDLKYQDEEYQDKTSDIQIYLDKRYYYLSSKLIENGDLVCEYCGKKHLEVGHRLLKDCHLDNRNPKLATIDHIVPRILNLIDPLDETNWAVACKKCNGDKGIKPAEQFREERLKIKKFNKKRNSHKKNKKRQLCVA